ncbi:MAG TPA: hypothetical protein VG963_05825 [Polyangiaceae bacterium]|nr:hypothetical protein [Polyangiaceae bacterium]
MLHINRWVALVAGVVALACSAAEESGAPAAQAEAEPVEAQVLNTVSVAGESIQFLEYKSDGEEPVFMLQNRGSAYSKGSILDRLEAEAGKLTLLETFYALAPGDAVPHPDLVQLHAVEVQGLGRADAAVRHVSFDVNLPVQKSASACDSYATANQWPGETWWAPANNNANMPNGGDVGRLCRAFNGLPGCDHLGTESQFVGSCNDGPGAIIVFDEWRTNSSGWKRDKFSVIVDPGHVIGWRFHDTNDLLHTQILGITNTDQPDFITPSYYVRARATEF